MPTESGMTSRYRMHSRIRAAAVGVTIFLVVFEALLGLRIPDHPYSGILLNNLSVERVSPGSPGEASGFRKGDEVVHIGGIPASNLRDVSEFLSSVRPGDTVVYRVRREGRGLTLPITFSGPPASEVLRKSLIMLVGLSFVAIGLLVYFRRSDKIALVFYLLCLAFGLVLVNVVNFEVSSARHGYKAAFYDLAWLALPALFLHFFLVFPERNRSLSRHPRVEYWLYCPAAALFLVWQYLNLMIFTYGQARAETIAVLQMVTAAYFVAFVVMGLVSFLHSYRRCRVASVRRKLRLVVWGTIAGLSPIVAVRAVLSVWPSLEIPGEKLVFLPLLLVPVAFGHAIVRYGLMDLEIVIKRSLVYTMLTAVLAAVYFAVVYGIGRLAARFVGSADLLFSLISIFCITLLISPLRARIRSSVDKTFFRDEYNYRMVLKQVSHSLAGIVNLESLFAYLVTRISEVFHASVIAIYLFDQKTGLYSPRYALNKEIERLNSFSGEGGLVKHLEAAGQTLNVERSIALDQPLPLDEKEAGGLARMDCALVVPFLFKGRLLGFMSIGRRLSGNYYAFIDVELLETLCDQASVAIENASLYLATVEKQKMEQELEVAREIQRRLLPKAFPEIRGLRTHGMNKPSKHVGGDYYDIIPLGAGKVAVVIADVAGKGVPAALLMASLQSSLRAEADPWRRPSEVISILNETIYEHTAGDTFATVFYGVIDFEREVLTYCSAGHTPPVIVRKNLTCQSLDRTSIVLGIESRPAFSDTSVPLQVGDLLFLYTDGITDELNPEEEPYGEHRLMSILRDSYDLDLETLLERVYGAVLGHTGGVTQDDLTALAIRVDSLAAQPASINLRRNP